MAATATRPQNTSPHTNSRMSSPQDSKKSIVAVTKTEGAYRLAIDLAPVVATSYPLPPFLPHIDPLTAAAPALAHVVAVVKCVARLVSSCTTPLTMASPTELPKVERSSQEQRQSPVSPLHHATDRQVVARVCASSPSVLTKAEAPPTVDISNADAKPLSSTSTATQPLAPPPRPAPSTTGDTPDYFNTVHNPFSLEPNVFEQSFGNPSSETPGRTVLPPVANITSPAPLPGITPGWQSLRAGPLSPAMLTGPTSQTDYFSESFRGFPTPNESSLRTGLTPGGGGSMFPAPSPNTAAIFNLQSGGVTPSTADFQQSALRAAAQAHQTKLPTSAAPTSQPELAPAGMERQNNYAQSQPQPQRGQNDHYANHDVSNAANDLLSFATQNGSSRNGGRMDFSLPNQPQQVNNGGHMPVQPIAHENGRRNTKGSINSIAGSADTGDFSDSGHSEQKTTTRSRGKKGAANGKQTAGTKRKADDAPKGGNRKAKGNNGAPQSVGDEDELDSDDESNMKVEADGTTRKMTDEEKRKNFLERNRFVAHFLRFEKNANVLVGLPLSNAASARSSGLPICRPRLRSSVQRMMLCLPPSPSFARRLSISRLSSSRTRNAPWPRLKDFTVQP